MNEQKLHYKYTSKEERLEGWREQRAIYDEWRLTPEGRAWVEKRTAKQLNLCFLCLTTLRRPIHVDHIFPLYLGGTSAKANMCIVHADCNIRKGAQVYMTYKEACKRRTFFNDLNKGVKVYAAIKKRPGRITSRREMKNIELLRQHFSEDQIEKFAASMIEKRSNRLSAKKHDL